MAPFHYRGRKQISGWLYESLITNKPYNQFVRELIAPPNDDSRGFIEGIKWRGEVSAGQTVEIQFAQSVSQSLLGINMKCASCHDSFIDRWKLKKLMAWLRFTPTNHCKFIAVTNRSAKRLNRHGCFAELGQVDPDAKPAERLKQLAELLCIRKTVA